MARCARQYDITHGQIPILYSHTFSRPAEGPSLLSHFTFLQFLLWFKSSVRLDVRLFFPAPIVLSCPVLVNPLRRAVTARRSTSARACMRQSSVATAAALAAARASAARRLESPPEPKVVRRHVVTRGGGDKLHSTGSDGCRFGNLSLPFYGEGSLHSSPSCRWRGEERALRARRLTR